MVRVEGKVRARKGLGYVFGESGELNRVLRRVYGVMMGAVLNLEQSNLLESHDN